MKPVIVVLIFIVFTIVQFESIICGILSSSMYGPSIFNPKVTDKDSVKYYLYTRENRYDPVKISSDVNTMSFFPKKFLPIKIIIHGWTHSSNKTWVMNMKESLLDNGDYNVLTVDWQPLAAQVYSKSAKSTKDVGSELGKLIIKFKNYLGFSLDNIHIIGHSLGAHVAGFAGQKITELTVGEKISRITGLDPANPLFENPLTVTKSKRLSDDDAIFVDVIHTAGGRMGFLQAIGHADFYPNGGTVMQPGCNTNDLMVVKEYCSHARSFRFFDESINSDNFLSFPCESYNSFLNGKCQTGAVKMGFLLSPDTRGVFYLKTKDSSPFALDYAIN